ncbi:unnamed protein product [Leptosia nina]|uniref:Uncharacterized protein n=1 Tax=Leptosia nina TaxID=320188 RepID=A0AAV1JIA6_9NEOP
MMKTFNACVLFLGIFLLFESISAHWIGGFGPRFGGFGGFGAFGGGFYGRGFYGGYGRGFYGPRFYPPPPLIYPPPPFWG